jgi:hypothetical protein
MHTTVWLEMLRGKDLLGDLGVGERIILKHILGKLGVRIRIGFDLLGIGSNSALL